MTSVPRFDVAIIGAGINGGGIARDAALRGLRVLILDKGDMCSGTSAISSRLIHGGLRYLEYAEIPLVYESLHERRSLRRNAEHLVKPLRINIPIFHGARRGPWLIRLGMIAYDFLSLNKKLPRHDMQSRDEVIAEEPGLRKDGLRGAARYYDAQVTFAERLVLENLLAARAAGAEIKTHCEVTAIRTSDGAVDSILYRNESGEESEVSVATVVNAAGPWVDKVLETAPSTPQRFIGGTKGSHIVVSPFAGAPNDAYYVEAAADGRPFFIIPWNEQYLIGTTDIRYEGSLDEIRASREEIEYLVSETNRVFPQANLTLTDINYSYAGVRPLPFQKKGPESAITRRHIIKINREIARGLISIIGGKLTTYRNLAEQTVDCLAKVLKRKLPECRTDDTLLPGSWGSERAREQLQSIPTLSAAGVDRMLSIYGGRAAAIGDLASSEAALAESLDDSGRHLLAEVVFAIREEFAASLIDIVFRRIMIGFDPDQGRGLYEVIAARAALELAWSPDELQRQLHELKAYADSLRTT